MAEKENGEQNSLGYHRAKRTGAPKNDDRREHNHEMPRRREIMEYNCEDDQETAFVATLSTTLSPITTTTIAILMLLLLLTSSFASMRFVSSLALVLLHENQDLPLPQNLPMWSS